MTEHRLVQLVQCLCALSCRLHQGGWDRTQTGRVSPVFVCFVFVRFTREGGTEHRLVVSPVFVCFVL